MNKLGIDEAGRGCLGGPVVVAGVILPQEIPDEILPFCKDSKTLSKKKRTIGFEKIKEHALAYTTVMIMPQQIDDMNILQATLKGMYDVVEQISNQQIHIDEILVDGPHFKPYWDMNKQSYIPHKTIPKGDAKEKSIGAASVLAKVTKDNYIQQLCEQYPSLKDYGWQNNSAYGTAQHLKAIKEKGITQFHRKSFGICKQSQLNIILEG